VPTWIGWKSLDVVIARRVCVLRVCWEPSYPHRDPFYTTVHVVTTIDSIAVCQERDCKEKPVVGMTNTRLSNPWPGA
jgi:hypothetical protein